MTHVNFRRASVAAVICLVGQVSSSAQTAADASPALVSSRPLSDATARLREVRGKIITYEEPILVWSGDLQTALVGPLNREYFYGRIQSFSIPPDVASEPDLALALRKTIEAYHQQTSGTRFQVVTSKLGYHIVPIQAHDHSGVLSPTASLLDSRVYVANQPRTAREHLEALGAAVASATATKLDVSASPFRRQGFDDAFRARPERFAWGAQSAVARDALIDLLDRSATSFSWHLLCDASPSSATPRVCVLNVVTVDVAIRDAKGLPTKVPLLFDRCGDCPPLRQTVAPSNR